FSFSFSSSFSSFFYSLSLHDALPILMNVSASPAIPLRAGHSCVPQCRRAHVRVRSLQTGEHGGARMWPVPRGGEPARRRNRFLRSEEHTSELQSPYDLVCRLLLEKKK